MAIVEESSSTTNAQETPLLPARITALINSIASHTAAISSTRARITDLADHIHTTHRDILEMSVRILEQTIHGSVARGLKARVEHLSSVAKALDFKIR
jgi:diphthamide biosynthesis protein 3